MKEQEKQEPKPEQKPEQKPEVDDSTEVVSPGALGGHTEDAQDNLELWMEWQS